MNVRRIFVLALLVSLCLGCEKAPAPGGAAEADDVVEIAFWYTYGGKNREVTEALIERFNKAHPKVRVKERTRVIILRVSPSCA